MKEDFLVVNLEHLAMLTGTRKSCYVLKAVIVIQDGRSLHARSGYSEECLAS